MSADSKTLKAVTPAALDGRARVVIARVSPQLDGGRTPVKRVLGDRLIIEADLLIDGHTLVGGIAKVRSPRDHTFAEFPLEPLGNGSDQFRAGVLLDALGVWEFTVEGWVDAFASWRFAFQRKVEAGQDVSIELVSGIQLIAQAAERLAKDRASDLLSSALVELNQPQLALDLKAKRILDPKIAQAMSLAPDRSHAASHPLLQLMVEPLRARFSAWYELFPRSTGKAGAHGTLKGVTALLPYISDLGFDVLYLPPIHPIGVTNRKGPNNSLECKPGDPGSPWAIGNVEGGHKSIHPQLGTAEDFRELVLEAKKRSIEIALDIAFQASPDHPYVKEHPSWFIHRSDGSIQTAENPPKKYQDVYPLNFESEDWQALWLELKSVFDHWIAQGVTVFRVDNPHTKPLPFWSWCLGAIKEEHPAVIFLAEAFTRPQLMYGLAKAGFSQSYSYFTWRNSKSELTSYLLDLVGTEVAEFLRPNLWPTTPDIFPEALQLGGRPAFISRLILAGTLSSNYGIYGPGYELLEHAPRPGTEELLDSEKYQLREWNLDQPDSLRDVIARLNRIRKENPALQDNRSLKFHATDNDLVICYSKASTVDHDGVLVVVNLDPNHTQAAWIDFDFDWALVGIDPAESRSPVTANDSFQVHDLLSDARYLWRGRRNYVQLDPHIMPAHIFRIRRLIRREQQFEYYL